MFLTNVTERLAGGVNMTVQTTSEIPSVAVQQTALNVSGARHVMLSSEHSSYGSYFGYVAHLGATITLTCDKNVGEADVDGIWKLKIEKGQDTLKQALPYNESR